ncbi:MAG TPA: long-chain fatty acid--CoA ligase [Nitrosomonas sp.]|nr:long-chain fatty acid--CoA ligase [Nitrosomonas sp.]HMW19636.1 long-chain fatty acid--CoA ligase [Nitrosomonas sp.]HMY60963.1 long-chain fatty acid--CoA ligase [Nitrosomonas sp.]HMY90849.1 long-chain fatty acid--CoA ligase [Nitrosomonas sp.]HNC41671.1 long-chain fatty acid--CoA ligase [Nitrosomonas sp.]
MHKDVIPIEAAQTLDGLFSERVTRSPQKIAYRDYNSVTEQWRDYSWADMARWVVRWQAALTREDLSPGDRVAIMCRNCPQWVAFEQAALGLGLVVVPLYTEDRAENAAYCIENAGVKLLVVEKSTQWEAFLPIIAQLSSVLRIVILLVTDDATKRGYDPRVVTLQQWLPEQGEQMLHINTNPDALATIIYTSGTTGRPKGVMLSHDNILSNTFASTQAVDVLPDDLFLSFLPLSHTFERTSGYYVPMMCGATVAYARSIQLLQEDLLTIQPTVLVSVPRIYERVYAGLRTKLAEGSVLARKLFYFAVSVGYSRFEQQQGRDTWHFSHLFWPILEKLVARKLMDKLGGRLRLAMSGGAALSPEISRIFIGLGLPILQGYGMTESSPVVCVNRLDDNLPSSIGRTISGVEVKLGENNALLIRGPNVMLGYWNNPEATKAVISEDGWLNSGDIAQIDEQGRVTITGRLKDIIVTSTGEKVPPADMEAAILRDPIFEQVMVVGEGRSYLGALVVLSQRGLKTLAELCHLPPDPHQLINQESVEKILLDRIAQQIHEFPGYAKIFKVALIPEPWSVANEMLTPTLKLKRSKIAQRYQAEIENLYTKR